MEVPPKPSMEAVKVEADVVADQYDVGDIGAVGDGERRAGSGNRRSHVNRSEAEVAQVNRVLRRHSRDGSAESGGIQQQRSAVRCKRRLAAVRTAAGDLERPSGNRRAAGNAA